ncbi:Phosphotyrosyl phosphatase activator [Scheffersomyces xylosifermentans]|uniref:Phosphotyrosyl phosphatase activator n=1 Tax=Scheffersomyces xylosifermentans TaxID=1304137 RepID=UPI00315DA456
MSYSFKKPVRRVITPQDLEKWTQSSTYSLILDFVESLQESVTGLTNEDEVAISNTTEEILGALGQVNSFIDKHPVIHEKDISRFGKVEFRDFYDEVSMESGKLLKSLVGEKYPVEAVEELSVYFTESWGNRTRIDYGSGHELNFISFLLCLDQLDLVNKNDYPALIIKVFNKYMAIMRRLQKIYWLEPAGSHGVWGLDDYHFLPFLFGSAQLATHPFMKPKSIHNEELVELYHEKYMYMECIYFINNIKTLPKTQDQKLSIRWHSPMLDDISSAKSWQKIKDGMIKMYKVEVLGKLPIIQHFMFGSILPCPEGISEVHDHDHDEDDCGHIHTDAVNTWGDCCGIKIPSAIAASESLKLESSQHHHKAVPFD